MFPSPCVSGKKWSGTIIELAGIQLYHIVCFVCLSCCYIVIYSGNRLTRNDGDQLFFSSKPNFALSEQKVKQNEEVNK